MHKVVALFPFFRWRVYVRFLKFYIQYLAYLFYHTNNFVHNWKSFEYTQHKTELLILYISDTLICNGKVATSWLLLLVGITDLSPLESWWCSELVSKLGALWPLKHSLGAAEDRRLHRGLLHATCTCFSCATIAPPNLSLMMIVVMMITIWLTVTIWEFIRYGHSTKHVTYSISLNFHHPMKSSISLRWELRLRVKSCSRLSSRWWQSWTPASVWQSSHFSSPSSLAAGDQAPEWDEVSHAERSQPAEEERREAESAGVLSSGRGAALWPRSHVPMAASSVLRMWLGSLGLWQGSWAFRAQDCRLRAPGMVKMAVASALSLGVCAKWSWETQSLSPKVLEDLAPALPLHGTWW